MNPSVKSEDNLSSKDRLILAGIEVFCDHSYEAATTRMIAKRAGVNIAAIPYYFNGKEGLYHAVVKHIVEQLQSIVRPTLKTIDVRAAQADLPKADAISLVETLLGKMVDFMTGAPEATRFAQIVLREHLHPTSAYEIIVKRVMSPIINGIAAMIAVATGQPLSDVMRIRALAFMGQVMAFRVARETMVRALGMTGYSADEVQTIRRVILEQTREAIERIPSA
jgi:AcrR family transcriptional regulator